MQICKFSIADGELNSYPPITVMGTGVHGTPSRASYGVLGFIELTKIFFSIHLFLRLFVLPLACWWPY